LDSSWLVIPRSSLHGAVVPDPSGPGRRGRLAETLRGAGAVVGHTVGLDHLPVSLQIAEIAAALQRGGVLHDDPVFVDEHLDAILVHRDPQLLAALRAQTLAPLNGLSPLVQDRLVETLASWLRHFGDRREMAGELHVHPQTVRYRMNQLQSLFGSTLNSPVVRAQLGLALVWGRPARLAAEVSTGVDPFARIGPNPRAATGANARAATGDNPRSATGVNARGVGRPAAKRR
jgi:hypothetical protein